MNNIKWLTINMIEEELKDKGFITGKDIAKELNKKYCLGVDMCDIRHIQLKIKNQKTFNIINVKGKGYIYIPTAKEDQKGSISRQIDINRDRAKRIFWEQKNYKQTIRNINIKEIL